MARAATLTGSKPNSRITTSPGAEAPKWSMPSESSAYRSHPKVAGRLDRQGGDPGGQHLVAVAVVLLRRTAPRTGRDTTRARVPASASSAGGLEAQRHLAARADEDDLGRAVAGIGQHVGAPGDAVGGPVDGLGQDGEVLAGQDEGGGALGVDGDPPRLGRLVGVGRPDHPETGHGPHGGQLLDRAGGSDRPWPSPIESWVQE